jgi:hypothetical protein
VSATRYTVKDKVIIYGIGAGWIARAWKDDARADARAWKHWWTVRGHIATLTATGRRGLFRCTLMLTRRDEVSQ